MEKDSPVPELVRAAARGDQHAWNDLVERYSPMLVAVIRQYRLAPAHVDDVAQTVWLRLVEHLGAIREPEALPGWIVTTARREAVRLIGAERRSAPFDPQAGLDAVVTEGGGGRLDDPGLDEELLRAEKHQALLAGLAELPDRQRTLLLLLLADPPLSYQEISEQTRIAVGSIGPTRGRAIERLRQSEPIRQFLDSVTGTMSGPEPGGRRVAVTRDTRNDRDEANHPWNDDDRLLADLADALAAVREGADGVAVRAQGALAWRTVDQDLMLAQLEFDSAQELAGAVRDEDVTSSRALVFSAAPLSVELEVGPQGLLGQIVPPGPAETYLEGSDGAVLRASADDLGFFVLPVPTAYPVRLRVETPTGRLVTDWFNANP